MRRRELRAGRQRRRQKARHEALLPFISVDLGDVHAEIVRDRVKPCRNGLAGRWCGNGVHADPQCILVHSKQTRLQEGMVHNV